jgi:hypothetical protein
MILSSFQIAAVLFVAFYLGRWRMGVKRRNGQSWESLIARLQHDCNARELSDHFLWKEGLSATPEETWKRLKGPRGLWAIYQNAGVMVEMAEFAARNSEIDGMLLETLRSDATQIRLCILKSLAQYAVNHANESVRMSAFRAASMYTGMAARMAQLLQDHAASALPEFVAAM